MCLCFDYDLRKEMGVEFSTCTVMSVFRQLRVLKHFDFHITNALYRYLKINRNHENNGNRTEHFWGVLGTDQTREAKSQDHIFKTRFYAASRSEMQLGRCHLDYKIVSHGAPLTGWWAPKDKRSNFQKIWAWNVTEQIIHCLFVGTGQRRCSGQQPA